MYDKDQDPINLWVKVNPGRRVAWVQKREPPIADIEVMDEFGRSLSAMVAFNYVCSEWYREVIARRMARNLMDVVAALDPPTLFDKP